MENRMTKTELAGKLGEHGIPFDSKATVAELRVLYANTIGKSKETTTPLSNQDEQIEKDNDKENSVPNKSSGQTTPPIDDSGEQKGENDDDDDEEQRKLDELLKNIPKSQAARELHELQIEEELLEAKLRVLEKKKRIAQLESDTVATMMYPITQHTLKPSYKDVKHLFPLFSGAEDYDANKWSNDFERACDTVSADDITRLKIFRQSMKIDSEAELFLRTDSSATYAEIRANFMANFGHVYSVSEVIDKLRKTTFSSAKTTVMGYILKMQEIASRAQIDEKQVVQFIVDGFEDNSSHIAILFPAQSIAQLKELSHRYAQTREKSKLYGNVSAGSQKPKPRIASSGSSSSSGASVSTIQCFNCSGIGHLSKDCTAPKRAKGSCFRCGSMEHQLSACTKPKPSSSNRVALINAQADADDSTQLAKAVGEMNTSD